MLGCQNARMLQAAHSFKPRGMNYLLRFSEHEMNNPLALCELAARVPNISAGHRIKQALNACPLQSSGSQTLNSGGAPCRNRSFSVQEPSP